MYTRPTCMLHLISSDVYAFIDDVVGEYMHERVDNVNAPCAAADSARWVRPRETRYRGRYTMLQLPPPSQGTTTLDILRLLEKSSIPSDQPLSPEAVHAHVMAKRVAFAARAARGRARVPVCSSIHPPLVCPAPARAQGLAS